MISVQKSALWLFASILLMTLCAPACGGSDKKKTQKPSAVDETPTADDEAEEVLIPAEKFDEIQAFFDRKRKVVTRCFTAAIDAGEASRRGGGKISVTMVIATSGKLKNVKVTDIAPESAILERCTLEQVRSWTVTDLPKDLDYSFTFGFGTL